MSSTDGGDTLLFQVLQSSPGVVRYTIADPRSSLQSGIWAILEDNYGKPGRIRVRPREVAQSLVISAPGVCRIKSYAKGPVETTF